jgi:predicted nucleic acid-binding protein
VSVFVDTSAFFAVLDAGDENHEAARTAWDRLLADREDLHTTNYVLVETAALLQSRLGLEALREFAADVLPVVDLHVVDEGQHRSAFHALLVASRRRLSLVDCASFECMRRAGLERAFCFDPHFTEQGFTVVPAAAA